MTHPPSTYFNMRFYRPYNDDASNPIRYVTKNVDGSHSIVNLHTLSNHWIWGSYTFTCSLDWHCFLRKGKIIGTQFRIYELLFLVISRELNIDRIFFCYKDNLFCKEVRLCDLPIKRINYVVFYFCLWYFAIVILLVLVVRRRRQTLYAI